MKLLPPGPRTFSEILKIVTMRIKDPITLYHYIFDRYGPIVYFKVGSNKFAMISDADAAEQILHTEGRHFTKSILYERFKLILGNGLLVSDGELWQKQRRLMSWAFSTKNIQKIHPIIQEECVNMIERWKQCSEVDMAEEMNAITLQIISLSLFGSSNLEQVKSVRLCIKHMLKYLQTTRFLTIMFFLSPIPMKNKHKLALKIESWLPFKDTRNFFKSIKMIDQLVTNMIEARKKLNLNDNLLDAMINSVNDQDKSQMTTKQLKDEAVTMFIAGHETTATALTWTWHMLIKHPRVMDKVKQELKVVLNGRSPSYEEISQLPYLKAVFEESMRLYPPFWRISRKTAGKLKLKEFEIPAGTNIVTSIYTLHRSPKYWNDPLDFNPERFMLKDTSRHRFSYIPFGAGMRACIGAQLANIEALTILATTIPHFNFTAQFTTDPKMFASLTLTPAEGCKVSLSKVNET
jgi:cytochrome P450